MMIMLIPLSPYLYRKKLPESDPYRILGWIKNCVNSSIILVRNENDDMGIRGFLFGWDDDELLQHTQATGLVYYYSFDDVPNTLKVL